MNLIRGAELDLLSTGYIDVEQVEVLLGDL